VVNQALTKPDDDGKMLSPGTTSPVGLARALGPSDAPPDIHHAPLRALWAYWASKREGNVLPGRQHIAPHDMRAWLGNLLLLDVMEGGRDFRYRLHGAKLVTMFGHDLTGGVVSALRVKNVDALLAEAREAVTGRRFVYIEDGIVAEKNFIRTSKLILPLATDGHSVDMLLVGIYPLE
jgi:hypothetical protein